MALVICHECGKEVSKTARSCPHCGATPKREKDIWYYVWIGVGLVIFYFTAYIWINR